MFGLTLTDRCKMGIRSAGVVGGLFTIILAGCGGSSDTTVSATQTATDSSSTATGQATATGSSSTATGKATTTGSPSQSTGLAEYDMVISGGVQVEWKSDANDGSDSSCIFPPEGSAVLGLFGPIDGKPYGLGILQAKFLAGTYDYPIADESEQNESRPFVQITTTTNTAIVWTADDLGQGSGTATVTGGVGGEVTLDLDLDLTPNGQFPVVHVKGRLTCPAS